MKAGSSSPVFAHREALTAAHLPERFEEREAERRALAAALEPTFGRGEATGVVVYGPAGQGKTTAISVVCRRSDERVSESTVPCSRQTTAYGAVIELVNELCPETSRLPTSGYGYDEIVDVLNAEFESLAGPHVVVFDDAAAMEAEEFDRLACSVRSAAAGSPVGIACVADDIRWRNDLDPETRRQFDEELYFEPYDEATLRAVLQRRVDRAFVDGTVTGSALDRCVALACDPDCDASFALGLLRIAGDRAEADGQPRITGADVDDASDVLRRERLADRLRDHTTHQRLTVRALLDLADERLPVRIREINEAYVRACERADVNPNRERALHAYLTELVEAGLVTTTERRSERGGRYYVYDLVPSPETLEEALGTR